MAENGQKGNEGKASNAYNPAEIEGRLYEYWEQNGFFNSDVDVNRKPYTIVIPPPNVTGALHLGHALNNVIQDVLIRYHRQLGFNALWLPGVDHAGIATQSVVEKRLYQEEGKTRHDIGREALVKRIWDWKDFYQTRIINQLKKLGCSCDWRRQAFTMNSDLSYAVRYVFMKLYEEGLIYRGKRLINWCPGCRTALSNDELVHKEIPSHFWHIKYPLKDDPTKFIQVATTRPETMLGDTAIAVHPDDERYTDLVGKMVILPLMNREIPIIADAILADKEKGTGAVKVTPAHDPNDYACGMRNNLEQINILNEDGTLNELARKYQGLFAAKEGRKAVVADLQEQGYLVKIEDHTHAVAHCYRSDDVVEPYLSNQWFVKMQPLVDLAKQVAIDDKVKFHPESRKKVYLDWLDSTPDWCISRQLWWGHRMPIWYCKDCSDSIELNEDGELAYIPDDVEPILPPDPDVESEPKTCPKCGGSNLIQDPNVLDTWFSSQLWPISTFGWPRKLEDIEYYYPTNVLSTARDIIALWVARMIMMGKKFIKEIPFYDVFIHSTILDDFGDIMSKSRGNGIDPVKTIDGGEDEIHGKYDLGTGKNKVPKDRIEVYPQYGTDALRYSFMSMTTEGQDIRLRIDRKELSNKINGQNGEKLDSFEVFIPKLEEGKRFMNKIWQVSTGVVLRQCEGYKPMQGTSPFVEDRYMIHSIGENTKKIKLAISKYRISEACDAIYSLFWDDFCSFYVEVIKPRLWLDDGSDSKSWAQTTLINSLDMLLRLMHPIMPYITEEIWQKLREIMEKSGVTNLPKACIVADYPDPEKLQADEQAEEVVSTIRKIIFEINRIRSLQEGVTEHTKIPTLILTGSNADKISSLSPLFDGLKKMCKIEEIKADANIEKPAKSAATVVDGIEVIVPLEGLIDFEAEKTRLRKEIENLTQFCDRIEKKLGNENYVSKAPAHLVEKDKATLAETRDKIEKLNENLNSLD